jgi:hypothetical protein
LSRLLISLKFTGKRSRLRWRPARNQCRCGAHSHPSRPTTIRAPRTARVVGAHGDRPAFEPPPWFVRIYGQRNGKPSPPMTQVPDVQAMPLGVRYHPPALCMGAA